MSLGPGEPGELIWTDSAGDSSEQRTSTLCWAGLCHTYIHTFTSHTTEYWWAEWWKQSKPHCLKREREWSCLHCLLLYQSVTDYDTQTFTSLLITGEIFSSLRHHCRWQKLHNVLRSLVLELQSPQADMVRNLNKSSGQFNNLSGRINKSSGRFINLSILFYVCMYSVVLCFGLFSYLLVFQLLDSCPLQICLT